MFREMQKHTNEELNVLKKRYNDNEAWWNRIFESYGLIFSGLKIQVELRQMPEREMEPGQEGKI